MTFSSIPSAVETQLNQKNQTITTLSSGSQQVTDVLFSGFSVKLSSLLNLFPQSGGLTLTIYADTLYVDVQSVNVQALSIIARVVDITALNGVNWSINPNQLMLVDFLAMNTLSNNEAASLTFDTGNATLTAPTNADTLNISCFELNSDGSITPQSDTFDDLMGSANPYNALGLGFAYATECINSGDLATARLVLNWICNTLMSCSSTPAIYTELLSQATALLLEISFPSNYHYLSPLSSSVYQQQISNLISIIEQYTTQLNNLDQEQATQTSLSTVYNAVSSSTAEELTPTQSALSQAINTLGSLNTDISGLSESLSTQFQICQQLLTTLNNTIASDEISAFLTNIIETVVDAAATGLNIFVDVSSGGSGSGDAVMKLMQTYQQGMATIATITTTFDTGTLISDAQSLLQQNNGLFDYVVKTQQLWQNKTPGALAAFTPTPVTIDPDLAWDNYMASVNNVLSNLSLSFSDAGLASSSQAAANNYLAALTEMSNYGKAINTKLIAYASQLGNAIVLQAKLNAINNISSIWNSLTQQSTAIQMQLAGLQQLINNRIDANMRSVYVAWLGYQDAFMYNFISQPPAQISINSTPEELSAALNIMQTWVAGVTGNQGSISLPNTNALLTLKVPVVKTGTAPDNATASDPQGLVAYLTPATATSDSFITLNIPKVAGQFASQINLNGEDVAIWITAGEFYLNWVKGNSDGIVPMSVSTSGTYINGYSPNFDNYASQPITEKYSYKAGNNNDPSNITIPWTIPTADYMLPTPFTQWTFEVDKACDVSGVNELYIVLHTNILNQTS